MALSRKGGLTMSEPVLGVRHSDLQRPLPPGACDCHVHVFGPQSDFPMSAARSYTPAGAPADALLAHQKALGLDRVVIIQPSIYGTDNRCTLDAVRSLGQRARGIAVVERNVTSSELADLSAGGIVGIRLNLAAAAVKDIPQIASEIEWAFRLTAPLGWHIQIFTELPVLSALSSLLRQAPVPVVIDHFGRIDAAKGLEQAGVNALVELVGSGAAYLKLSAPYLISTAHLFGDVRPFVSLFSKANPERLLWGSNWPHPGGGTGAASPGGITPFRDVDDGHALDRLAGWVADDTLLKTLLVDNPARLFGFAKE